MFWAGINLLTTDQKPNFFLPINNLSRFWLVTKKGLKIYMFYFLRLCSDFFFFYLSVELIRLSVPNRLLSPTFFYLFLYPFLQMHV